MHVVIVGGGVIGLSIAWRSLQRGLAVTLIDPAIGTGASHAAAGILTTVADKSLEQTDLFQFALTSYHAYPDFVAELEESSESSVGYRRDGILEISFGDADRARMEVERRFRDSIGLTSKILTSSECCELEPLISPEVSGGMLALGDGSIDPRRLINALLVAVERLGGTVIDERVTDVLIQQRADGVLLENGDFVRGDRVVLAAGCWTHRIGGLPPGLVQEIRPVKGQTLRLWQDPHDPDGRAPLGLTTRARVSGASVYLVPRTDGELVIGSTQEDCGYDTSVTAGGLWKLLRDAHEVAPGITDMPFSSAVSGLRPGSPDDLPLIGPTDVPDLLLATGHFRFGVMLAPATAEAMAGLLISGDLPKVARPFRATRFGRLTQ